MERFRWRWGDNYADPVDRISDSIGPDNYHRCNTVDKFPLNNYQWEDTDGDWYGDNQLGDDADGCPTVYGNSTGDRFGCLDTDGDGYSDPTANWGIRLRGYRQADGLPLDPTQWCDADGEAGGENPTVISQMIARMKKGSSSSIETGV